MSTTLILLIAALLLSAFFSGMETAFVSSSRLRYEVDKGDHTLTSRILGIFYRHPDNYISTMLVGNNIVLVVYSILMAKLLDPLFVSLADRMGVQASDFVLLLADTLISTLIVIIFGEFLPKTTFRTRANNALRAFSALAYLFYIILYPLSRFSAWCSRMLLRIVGLRIDRKTSTRLFTRMDLDDLIESGISSGDEPPSTEVQIFRNALDFSSLRVRDCMIPRNEIAAVFDDCTPEELLHKFVETGYSKIIVCHDTTDNIIGYIHSSDLFVAANHDPSEPKPSLLASLKTLPIVPETANVQKLMSTLMQQKKSLAVVVDEFGGTAGIISLEDIIEELIGDIEDEHDTTTLEAQALDEHTFILSARLETEKVNEQFSLDLPLSDDYHTVGGLILAHHHSIPTAGEVITIPGGFEFTILKAAPGKILRVRLHIE